MTTTYLKTGDSSVSVLCVKLSFVSATHAEILVSFLRDRFDFDLWTMYSHALFRLCRPSSLDAIFLAHALVVLHALPVSYIINYTMLLIFVLR